ncbi:MAG TPA: histidine kinase dimerization/phospho-acceptor domain-containing protein [Bacteroidota bacterium]|nr:histidine kinase dimerization/phospho-acceptor domain-containing protein [Bacteroidota bacterium]
MRKLYVFTRDFVTRYPAVLASYFIYGYYFISTLDFYVAFKKKHLGASETLSHFDTLLWMWALAWALVRVIDLREKLSTKEKENLSHQHTIQLKETQLQTLNEVVTTLKHRINNPLAIILGYVRLAKKKSLDRDVAKKLDEIEVAAQRINNTMKEFTLLRVYQTMDSPVGNLVDTNGDKDRPESPLTKQK